MALAIRETSPQMREAARFLRYLRHGARSDGYYNSGRLRDYWRKSETEDRDRFRDVCETITGDSVYWCDDCSDPVWKGSWHGETGDGTEVCNRCLGNYYYCEHCEQYYSESHEHEHETGSVCDVPQPRFRFPLADGRTLASDDILDVETPAGLISDRGMQEIADYLYDKISSSSVYYALRGDDFDHEWTNKSGNFTKRVAKLALQNGTKIPPEVLSEVGNLARAHAASGKSYRIAFSRDLNAEAGEWYHGGSCWWTDYAESRCALKQCGGLGIRTFDSYNDVSGRAWILPLDDALRLTDDPMNADAFVVFNAYGPDGYEFARILAQLTGWSYRKISFHCRPMYINGGDTADPGVGFLIAPVQVCERTAELSFRVSLNCGCNCCD